MRSNLLLFTIIGVLGFGAYLLFTNDQPTRRAHKAMASLSKGDDPAEAFQEWAEYEFNLLKNPVTGTIPEGTYAAEWAQALATEKVHEPETPANRNAKTTALGTWSFKGPDNLGGRTRAIGIDVGNNNIILAGNVSGGISRTTNGGASWTNVTPVGNIRNITSIAQDTRTGQTSTWYFCTGEALGNSASANGAFFFGNGVYKSTDNGVTWARLTASNAGSDESFDDRADLCSRVAVNPSNGDVYVAVVNGILRSQNGGTSWSLVLSNTFASSNQLTDIVITTGGTMYAAFSGAAGGTSTDGVWTSTTGNSGAWTRIAGNSSPTGWNASAGYGRVVLALAPSSQSTLYALYYNNTNSNCASPAVEADLFRYDQGTTTWTDLSANLPDETGCLAGNDPFAVQGGYDLCIAVKPNNASVVFVGGTNVYRSTSGFTTTSATTRIGGYASPSSYALYSNHHPDVHELKFASGNDDILYTGDDGGIQKADITNTTVSWTSLNNSYPSYQYYHVALDPVTASTLSLGGAQDNGTTFLNTGSSSGTMVFSGDGASVGMTAGGGAFYLATQNGNAYRDSPTLANIQPATGKSLFVTNFHLDEDNTKFLYYANGNDLYRTANAAATTTSSGWTLLSGLGTAVTTSYKIYGIATSRGAYSTNTAAPATLSRLYVGTNNGQLFRLDDPQNVAASTAPANITPTGMTGVNTIVDVAVNPTDSRKVMVVYSNYGVASVWYTADASALSPVWSNVEGNISLLSFRSVVILSDGTLTSYVVGTSKGLYSTVNLNGSSTVWSQEASTLIGYTPVVSIAYRPADQTLLAGSHGNGMFISRNFPLPLRFLSFTANKTGNGDIGLYWSVAQSEKVARYIVQRSADGLQWTDIATVPTRATASDGAYEARDATRGSGKLLYRIRAVEVSGDAYYSVVVPVSTSVAGGASTPVYPTVVTRDLHIEASGADQTAILTDLSGRTIISRRLSPGKNTQDLSALPAGQYAVSVFGSGKRLSVTRIIKQ